MGKVKILKASAGSGKTYRLAYEYIRGVVVEPYLYRATLAVTFTNKATEQMKRRILAGLDGLVQGDSPYLAELMSDTGFAPEKIREQAGKAMTLILHDYSRFAVSTIDKFFQRIARAFFKELGLDFDYTVEIDREWILAAAIDRLLERTAEDPVLYEAVARLIEQRTEDGLGWNVAPDIARIGQELFKEEYAGKQGGTELVFETYRRIGQEIADRFGKLKARAAEAVRLIEEAGLTPTDFKQSRNSFAGYLYRLAASDIPLKPNSYFAKCLETSEEWCSKTTPLRAAILGLEPALMPLLREIGGQIEAVLVDHNSRELVGENFGRSLLLDRLNEYIRAVSAEKNRMMIHETAALIHRLVTGNDAPFIYEKVGNTYSRYLIDEFQDTSQRQWQNFLPLLDNALAETEGDAVMLIGDVKQSIYRWRGGNWRLLGFEAGERFADALSEPVAMDTNWRSERNVIDFNNTLIRRVAEADSRLLTAFLKSAPAELRPLASVLEHSYEGFEQKASPVKMARPAEGYVQVHPSLKEQIGPQVVETVADLLARGYALRDIAILIRSNGEARRIADLLLEAGYPIVSQETLLLSGSPVVGFIMAALRLAQYPDDGISLAQYNAFLKRPFGEPVPGSERAVLDQLPRLPLVEAYERLLACYRLNEQPEAVSFIQALYQVVISSGKQPISDIRTLLDWWEENKAKKTVYLPSEQDAVTVMTIHKAKGLEFPCVIVPYCDWELLPKSTGTSGTTLWAEAGPEGRSFGELGAVPLNYKKSMEQSHYARDYYRESVYAHVDNINLLYVALTRAERELYVLYDRLARGEQRVSKLIDAVLTDFPGMSGTPEPDGTTVSRYGSKTPAPSKTAKATTERSIEFSDFPAHDATQRIRVRWTSDRYFGEDRDVVSPRRYGVVMHRLFESLDTVDGIDTSIQRMIANAEVTPSEAQRLKEAAGRMFREPEVARWFDPAWEVRSEQDIITKAGIRRPDRVLTQGGQAVVVDYKFGSIRQSKHRAQVSEYMDLLREMGYRQVEGYLWYVELGEVEPVL